MPDIHDFRFVKNQQKRQIGGTIMEERKYTFYDRYQKMKYANITAEELEVLNISYNKEHYMFEQQHQHTSGEQRQEQCIGKNVKENESSWI